MSSASGEILRFDPSGHAQFAPLPWLSPQEFARRQFRLDRFVVGASNRLAHAACQSVCQGDTDHYNPVFIHGPVGCGKTHLLVGTCLELRKRCPEQWTELVPAERFVQAYIQADETNSFDSLRRMVRQVDNLLIDDVQFMAGKDRTQEEFFHTFNDLFNAGRRLMISASAPPRELSGFEERLLSRFEWGLVARIDPPQYETRVRLIHSAARDRGKELPDEVVLWLAEELCGGVRELEGAVTRLLGVSELTGQALTIALAVDTLADTLAPERKPGLEQIVKVVLKRFDMRLSQLQSKRRSRHIVLPRQICMFLARKMTDLSLEDIGTYFGGRDHTTVMHACRKIEHAMQQDAALARTVREIRTHAQA